jgi:murein DD-endopeptidase MepM/ murein hydrolase activator NlpD
VAALRDRVDELRVEATRTHEVAVRARDDLTGRTALMRQQRDRSEDARRQADESAVAEQALLVEVTQKRAEYTQRIALASATSGGIAGTLSGRQTGQQLPLATAGMFAPPLAKPVVSSGYGSRPDPFGGPPRVHQGIDFSAVSGTPILASADGMVVIASDQSGYGNCTVIDHGSGLATLYGHQSAFNVEIGDRVTRGQVIGFVGSTGHSTGPHLHWEVRQFGQPVDPLPFLGSA